MEKISVPISWIHGRHDAWMDVRRVERLLSAGDTSNRKLLEVPIGHQLRTSKEALETFQLVATEVARMLTGQSLRPCTPSVSKLERARLAERKRLPTPSLALQDFWEDYLLGRDRSVGIELMTSTSAYRELMDRQIDVLELEGKCLVLDLGSGTGSLPVQLAARDTPDVKVVGLDFVRSAIVRSRSRLNGHPGIASSFALADMDLRNWSLPIASGAVDRILASLFLSYLSRPDKVLEEARRVLRPGGRIVVSCLRRDADISKIYVDGVSEVLAGGFPESGSEASYAELQRRFLNDAARILDLEEAGVFTFYEEDELLKLLRDAGFSEVRAEPSFGNPPQAFLATGIS